MSGERADAASVGLGLREERMIGEAVFLQQRLECAGAAAEAKRVHRQHRVFRRHVIALVSGRLELLPERLAENHPERVARRRAVASGQHELVAVRMLRAAIVVVQSALRLSRQMRGDVERRVGERSAKMARLRVVAEQHQRHARHEADVFHMLQVGLVLRGRRERRGFHGANFTRGARAQSTQITRQGGENQLNRGP